MTLRSLTRSGAGVAALAATLCTLGVASASAATIDPLAPTQGFDLFVQGDVAVTANENEGTAALGGTLTIPATANYRVGNQGTGTYTAAGDTAPTALYVGGTVAFGGGQLTVNGNQHVRIVDATGLTGTTSGGTADVKPHTGSGSIHLNTGQAVSTMFGRPANAIDFAAAFTTLRADATALAGLTPTVTPTNANGNALDWSQGTVDPYVTLASGTNVLELTADQLKRLGTITFRNGVPSGSTLIINVLDWTTGTWNAPNFSGIGKTEATRILLNFPTATQLVIGSASRTIEGTVYAPNAEVRVESASNVEGSIVAAKATHTGGGELHSAPFTGTPDTPGPATTPTTPDNPTTTTSTTTTPDTPTTPAATTTPTTPEETVAPAPIVTAAPSTAPVRTPQSAASHAASGRARLGGTVGCAPRTVTMRVSGRQLRSVSFSIDGHHVKTVRPSAGHTATLTIARSHLAYGTHRVAVRVRFTAASGSHARVLTRSFSRCRPIATPSFTG